MEADTRRHRLLIVVIVGGLALTAAAAVGLYGLLAGPSRPGPSAAEPPSTSVTPSAPATPNEIAAVPPSSNPEEFARAVAAALFNWTTVGRLPADYAQPLIDVADETEADAVVADIFAYLPSQEAWATLRTHQTRQWLTIDSATVPDTWIVAQGQAAPGQLPDGATAVTIEGSRHRDGTWGTQPLQTSRPVAFTVFLICPGPSAELSDGSCRLLRLSRPDSPLR